jgi:integrase
MATVRQYRGRYVADFRDQNGEHGFASRNAASNMDKLPAAAGEGGVIVERADLLRTGLHAALRRATLRQVRFHDLRHSFASNLLGAGTDIVTVSKALGHANVHITLTTHAHAIPRERQGAGMHWRD